MKKFLVMGMVAVLLAGCASTQPKTVFVTKAADPVDIITPELPREISTRKFQIVVYDKQKLQVALADPEFRKIIGLSDKDYAAMNHNYNEAIRYINAQAAIINYYEKVIRELKNRNIVKDAKS